MRYWDHTTERLPQGKIEWPGGTRLAVLLCFDYQAEAGDTYVLPNGLPNYAQLTEASYGGRVGIWRILDLLDRQGVKATFNTCGITAENYPETARAIVQRGHDIGGHAYDHDLQFKMTPDDERVMIKRTVDAIKKITGVRITGWRCPRVQPSPATLKLLVEEGFVWDSDFLNGDTPYMLDVAGAGKLVEIPYTFSTDDIAFIYGSGQSYGFPAARNTPADLYQLWKDEFDVLYAEAATSPKMFIFQCHPFIMGRAHRSRYYEQIIAYMKTFASVRFFTCDEVAKWWLAHYDEPAATGKSAIARGSAPAGSAR